MKIAQLAPLWLPVPPKGYGGTEIVVYNLTEELVRRGHDVTLFASGDSKTSAKLFSVFPKSIGNSGELINHPLYPLLHYIECFKKAGEFDIIHNHAQYYAMFLADLVKTPVVHTIHGSYTREYTPEEKMRTLERFNYHNFVSISNAQRKGLEALNYIKTVYNGIDFSNLEFIDKRGDYLVWLGRITSKKGPVEAIRTARKLDIKLKIAAAIDPLEMPFFETEVKPLIDGQLINFQGEVSVLEKSNLFKGALCTLYPVQWEEPFGLVMVESMACGTPVVAFAKGSVPEIIKDGETGFIINASNDDIRGDWIIKKTGIEGLCEAVEKINTMPSATYGSMRYNCHKHVEDNFSIKRMANGYEEVYKKILEKK